MRLDDFLSTVGVIKRRTVAKELADAGMVLVNGQRAKPSREIHAADRISIKGKQAIEVIVRAVPRGNVAKERRGEFAEIVGSANAGED